MAVFYALVVGLTLWLSLWAFGVKALDSFMLTVAVVFVAVGYQFAKPYLLQQLGRD